MGPISGLQNKAAVHAFEDKAKTLLEPLIGEDEDSDDESSQYSAASTGASINVEAKQTGTEMIKTAAVSLGLMFGAVVSTGAIITAPVVAVIIMAGACIVNVPYSAYKEFRIVKLPALRNLNNALREDANKLEEDMDVLSEQIELLQPEADRATAVEEELKGIAHDQRLNVDKIIGLVKENEAILKQTRENLRQRIVQDIIKIVVMSDKNNDGRFSKVETKFLVLKLSLQLQEYGVEFDEEKFYRVMAVDPSVAQTLTIVKRLIPSLSEDDESEEDEDDYDTYDMFHMASESSLSGSLVTIDESRPLSLSITSHRKTRQN